MSRERLSIAGLMATAETVSPEIMATVRSRYEHAVIQPLTPGRFPFYAKVPKTPVEHLQYRRAILWAGYSDPEAARTLWMMCKRDILFWINTFVWTIDPRKPELPPMPFNTWYFQDWFVQWLEDLLGKQWAHVDKSRDMGATWIILMVFFHRWWFFRYQSFMLISNKWEMVDVRDEPDSLFPKLDLVLNLAPAWLRPRFKRKEGALVNLDGKGIIKGVATVENAGRGGRKKAVLVDEAADIPFLSEILASLLNSTDCVIMNSTPQGEDNEFARMRHVTRKRLSLHWALHPDKVKGFYLDDGKMRSPWYDNKCVECGNPTTIAQELDINYHGSGYVFFDAGSIDRLEREWVRSPSQTGMLVYDELNGEPIRFAPAPRGGRGPLRFWTTLDASGRPPQDRQYMIGVDVSQGTGASNSVIVVGDTVTREVVAEYASPNISPHNLGTLVHAMARWFQGTDDVGAKVNWESHGPGRSLAARLVDELGYLSVYFQREEVGLKKTTRRSMLPGCAPTDDTKDAMLHDLRDAMKSARLVTHSAEMLAEFRLYQFQPSGHIASSKAMSKDLKDPSGAKKNHGDRVSAAAVLWMIMKNTSGKAEEEGEERSPYSYGARRERWQRKQKADARW